MIPQITSRVFHLHLMPKGSVCAEIGVHEGEYSAQILEIVQPRKLHLIDPWMFQTDEKFKESWYGGAIGRSQEHMELRYHSVLERFKNEIASGQVVVHRMTSSEAAPLFPNDYFDWIYIDGDHYYEAVRDDLNNYYPKVKSYIAGDDYGMAGFWDD